MVRCTACWQCFMWGQGSLNLSWNIYESKPFKLRREEARRRTKFSVFLGSCVKVIGQIRPLCLEWESGGCHYKHNSVGRGHWEDGHQSAGTNFSSSIDSPFFQEFMDIDMKTRVILAKLFNKEKKKNNIICEMKYVSSQTQYRLTELKM